MSQSILMCVGEQSYKLHEFVFEAMEQGISKRTPVTSIPTTLVPGVSKIFVAHPKAMVYTKDISGLFLHLYELDYIDEQTYDKYAGLLYLNEFDFGDIRPEMYVPEYMLDIAMSLSMMSDADRKATEDQFQITYGFGVFGYAPFEEVQYVLPSSVDELPEEVAHLEKFIRPVHVAYDLVDEGDDSDD